MVRSVSRMNQFQKYFYLTRFKSGQWCIYLRTGPYEEGKVYVQAFKTKEEGLRELKIIQEGEW